MKNTKSFLFNTISFSLLLCLGILSCVFCAQAQTSQDAQQKIKQKMQAKQIAAQNNPNVPTANAQSTAPTTAPNAEAKKTNVYRVGILMPKAQMTQDSTAADAATALQTSLVAYLKGPAIEVVPIEARIPAQIEAEIKEKHIDFLLYANLTQKKGSGGFGSIMKIAAPIAMMASPIGILGGLGGMVAAGAAGAAIQGVAGSVKAKDELTLEYKLVAPGMESAPRLANTTKAKAKKDGEDVLTPMIEQAATAIVTDLTKK